MIDWMELAKDVASWSRCTKRQVGAVIERNGVLCGVGNNDTALFDKKCLQEEEGDYSSCAYCGQFGHAEATALTNCELNGAETTGATLYLYGHDHACEDCIEMMEDYGIKTLVIG